MRGFAVVLFILQFYLYNGLVEFDGETRLKNVKQLTFGGVNTSPKFSPDGRYIAFLSETYTNGCRQIYKLDLKTNEVFLISSGIGDHGSFSFHPDGKSMIYSSTFHHFLPLGNRSISSTCLSHVCNRKTSDRALQSLCTPKPRELKPEYDLFKVNQFGNTEKQLTFSYGYDGDVEISPDGNFVLYTSMKTGDPELWLMSMNTSLKQPLLKKRGFEESATFSPHGSKIVFAAPTIRNRDVKQYNALLKYNLVQNEASELFTIDLDGSKRRKITRLGGRAVTPTFTPDGRKLFFSSNHARSDSNGFDIFQCDTIGWNVERVTFNSEGTDISPSINSRGTKMVWSSSRNATSSGELNIFIADFVDEVGNYGESSTPKRSDKLVEDERELHFPEEKHLGNVKQITFGGQNAEGYFNFAGDHIVFQATGPERYGTKCDQIYRLNIEQDVTEDTPLQRISTGLGACTCSYFFPDDQTMIYASTFAAVKPDQIEDSCPTKKCQSSEAQTDPVLKKLCNTSYTWDLFPDYDIYKVNKYGNILKRLTNTPGYDAEGAVSKDGRSIVFTSLRTGDPELFIMDADGGNVRQLTNETGYDGGPFFSPDGTKVIFRASRPKTREEVDKYDLVEPLAMELHVINVDGTGLRKITELGGSNWAPFYLDNNKRILFSTNFNNTGFFGAFDLYAVDEDGAGLERITFNRGGFDAFPMQSRDGAKLAWGSSRNGKTPYDLNLFLSQWIR